MTTMRLSVRQVREALYREGRELITAGNGEPSSPYLGTLFHQACHELLGPAVGLITALQDADHSTESWPMLIQEQAYRQTLGPALSNQQASLQGQATPVMALWRAVGELSRWLTGLIEVVASEHRLSPPAAAERFLEHYVRSEQALECELKRPEWRQSVVVAGIADLIVKLPQRAEHQSPVACIVEFKLGQSSPEIDVAQACLYQRLLQSQQNHGDLSLAIVHFQPALQEHLIPQHRLAEAQASLEHLIGRLANVDHAATSSSMPTAVAARPETPTPIPTLLPVDDSPILSPLRSHGPTFEDQSEQIVKFYREFDIAIRREGSPIVGPTFVRHRFSLGRRVTVRQLQTRAQELQLRLQLESPPVISTDAAAVLIDVQRRDRQTLHFEALERQLRSVAGSRGCSKLLVGVGIDGQLRQADLNETENCHILVAGTTGSGKSEWLRTAMASLILNNTPETLQFLLIDPKRVAFLDLKKSPFLMRPIVYPDSEDVVEVLEDLVVEMERRFRLFETAECDNLDAYMRQNGLSTDRFLPRIVCICDEYGDLVTADVKQKKAIEQQIKRLGMKARAAGIHLILATQDPRRDVVTGTIKANLSTRIALNVAEATESRTMLQQNGAESLLPHGDLLCKDVGSPKRYQAPLLSEDRRKQLFGENPTTIEAARNGHSEA